ncbi:MAG: thioredoxin domain-containing protein [Planctomycetota bacterium]
MTRPRHLSRALLCATLSLVGLTLTGGVLAQDRENADRAKEGMVAMQGSDTTPKHTNRLIRATSPYLLQHAHNPVDWHEWNPEAFEKAKREDKPIFLSIGYAACHWCHVMEHESFEHEEVAEVMNRFFVNVKVDREERPDVDEIYMAYTQARTGHGGWPMSVWLTPDGAPFFAGTYFPSDQFVDVLGQISETWRSKREQVIASAEGARDFFAQWSATDKPAEGVPQRDTIDQTAVRLARAFDSATGGVAGGGRNKFPPSMAMELMLRVHHRNGDQNVLEAVDNTLDHMARGGIYDHLGGGICRYSTDTEWLVPHFEKMLYDQAMVSAIYLDGYQVTRKREYAAVAADIFDYVIADLQSSEGGFYSSRDADSDGFEGAFYIWTVDQVGEVLGEADAKLFCSFYDVTETGNWFERMGHAPRGPKNVLRILKKPDVFAKLHGLSEEEVFRRLKEWRGKMQTARNKRTSPGLDDKILVGWNGLMIGSLAKGASVLNEPKYAQSAERAAEFILAKMLRDGRLFRTYRKGESRLTAYMEDYAFLIEGLLNLYEATFDRKWLDRAVTLSDTAMKYYLDESGGGFYFTASDGEALLARSKNPHDSAIPSPNSVHALNLLRLAVLTGRKEHRANAERLFKAFAGDVTQNPFAFERQLCALDFYHDRVKEIAILGDSSAPETAGLLRMVHNGYLPNKVVVHAPDLTADTTIPLLTGKTKRNGLSTAYVCENYTCQLPVTSPADLAKQLDGVGTVKRDQP